MKKLLCFAVCLLMAVTPLGCSDKKSENIDGTMLFDFEKGLVSVKMQESFGAISLNEESEFVKDGKRSLKLMPSFALSDEPLMMLPFTSAHYGFSYSDLGKITNILMDIYAEKDCTINIGVYFSALCEQKSYSSKFYLSEGWNSVDYNIIHELIAVQYNLSNCYGVYIGFDVQDPAPIVYLDNVRIREGESNVQPENIIALRNTETYFEIADFENAYSELIMFPYYNAASKTSPSLKIVTASDVVLNEQTDERLTAPAGDRVMRLTTHAKDGTASSWVQIQLAKNLLEAVNFKRFAGEPQKYVFRMEIYQNCDRKMNFELNPYTSTLDMDWANVITEKGKWKTCEVALTAMPKFLNDPYLFCFAYGEYDKAEYGDCEYFIDNLRIEKIA